MPRCFERFGAIPSASHPPQRSVRTPARCSAGTAGSLDATRDPIAGLRRRGGREHRDLGELTSGSSGSAPVSRRCCTYSSGAVQSPRSAVRNAAVRSDLDHQGHRGMLCVSIAEITAASAETGSPGFGHACSRPRGRGGNRLRPGRDETGQLGSCLQMNSPMWSRNRYSSPGKSSYIWLMPSGVPAARNRIRSLSVWTMYAEHSQAAIKA